jgi:phosphate transport system permease protein
VSSERFKPNNRRRRRAGMIFKTVCLVSIAFSILSLALLLFDVVRDGAGWLSIDLLTHYPSRIPERAGIKSAILGTLWMMGLTAAVSFPIGVGAAIYLEEYAPKNWLTRILQTNIANLAGVPSIVYGILGLAIFVRYFALGRSVVAGALTLALLILPVIIIRHHIFPVALPGILTGTILSLSRAIGETAPLIMIGALTFIAFPPKSPMDPFTVLPIQIFNWTAKPQKEFHELAAAAIIVLLVLLLVMNAAAIFLRNRYQKRI